MSINLKSISRLVDWCVRYRVPITFIIFVALILEDIITGVRPHDIHRFQDSVGVAGFCLALVGIFLRSWAAGVIHKAKSLATTGPYAICRNPLYLGSLFLTVGICIVLGCRRNLMAIILLVVFIYIPKIRKEEQHLKDKFGDEWQRYTERTPALIPIKFSANLRTSSWSKLQWLRNKEYNAFLTGLMSLIVLEMWHELMR